MELADIITLVKAGYTKDEIAQMEVQPQAAANPEPVQLQIDLPEQIAEPSNVPAQVVEPVTPAVPVAQPVPQQQPTQAQPDEQSQPSMADLMQGIAKLTSAVQANAIANSFIPGGIPKAPDAAEVLGQIIRPTRGKKEV